MKTLTIRFSVLLVGMLIFCHSATGEKPVYEMIDHSRGIKITTFSENWSNTVSRFGIKMIYNPGFSKLEIDKAFGKKKTVGETVSKQLDIQKESNKAEILSEEVKLNVGGIESKGFSFVVLKSREVFVRTWFTQGERLFEVELQAKEKNFEAFLKSSKGVLDAIEFLDAN